MAPENTMAGFEICANLGWDLNWIRSCAFPGSPSSFTMTHSNAAQMDRDGSKIIPTQLKKLDAGSHFSTQFRGEAIPTLGEVLETYGKQVVIDIEIKDENFRDDPGHWSTQSTKK